MGTVKSVQLFFQEGTSDKLYNAQIVEDAGAYTVAVQWGRRGSKLQEGSKAIRVSRAKAEATFDKIVREKRSKGYEEVAGNVRPASVAPPTGQGSASKAGAGTKRAVVGHAAQLLTAIEDDEVDRFLADDDVIAQQKLDGVRVLVHITPTGELVATNRNGQPTQMAGGNALAGLAYLPKATVVDGEILDDAYWIFDVLQIAGTDVRTEGYLSRWAVLDEELEPALTVAAIERNVTLSGLNIGTHERVAVDAFEFFERAHKQGRTWDLVIVDPPSFAPNERSKAAALRAYERLATAALSVTASSGRFALASCSSHITEADLLGVVADITGSSGIGPTLRLRQAAGAASDHPVLPAFAEGRYLKFLFFDKP